MSQDQLRSAIDALRTRIQTEFDSQLNAIEQQQAQALDEVRQSVRAEADAHWMAEIARVRAEAEAHGTAEIARVRAEAEAHGTAEIARVRAEAEAHETAEIARVRAEVEAHETAEIARVRAEVEAHWTAEIARVRAEAEARSTAEIARVRTDADAHWTAEIARLRAEWSATMDNALSQAAADADRRLADGIERTRIEVEEHAGARARLDLEHALAQERGAHEEAAGALKRTLEATTQDLESARTHAASLEAQLQALKTRLEDEQRAAREQAEAVARELREATTARDELRGESDRSREELERTRAAAEQGRREAEALRAQVDEIGVEVDRLRAALESERATSARALSDGAAARAAAVTEVRAAERQSHLAAIERLRDGVRKIAASRSLSDALAVLATAGAAQASRAVVFVVKGQTLHPMRAAGFDNIESAAIGLQDPGAIATAVASGAPVTVTPANAPAFAALQSNRAGLAVPITVGRQAVAVVYVDNGRDGAPEVPAAWPEAVEILCAQASSTLAQLTALRTAQAMRLMQTGGGRPTSKGGETSSEADDAARRYARLLISEIKLYNEGAVRVGREQRDLLTRLRDEIGRARRLYEERVPQTVTARDRYFDDQLRQILADGDASCLGNSTVTS